MTRRERLEARLEKRQAWAESRRRKAVAAFGAAHRVADGIPLGQPILVGHHSERHARRDQERITSNMAKGCESQDMAAHHASKAGGLARQLECSIFSDDPGSAEACEARAVEIDAEAERCKALNAAFRKAKGDDQAAKLAALVRDGVMADGEAVAAARLFALCPYHKQPFPAYHLSNLRANARRLRERVKAITRRKETEAEAVAAGGVVVKRHPDYGVCSVTFAEKPERETLAALRAAGYVWGGGSWSGNTSKLPECVVELEANQGQS